VVRGFLFQAGVGKVQQVLGVGGLTVFSDPTTHLTLRIYIHELYLLGWSNFYWLLPVFYLLHLLLYLLLIEPYPVIVFL
jgi:hypothetical protein